MVTCEKCGSVNAMDSYDLMSIDKNGMVTDSTTRTVMCHKCGKSMRVGVQAMFINDEREILEEIYSLMDCADCCVFMYKFNDTYKDADDMTLDNVYERVIPVMYLMAYDININADVRKLMLQCVRSSMVTHVNISEYNTPWYEFINNVIEMASIL